jgi:hypothetical protein
MGKKPWTIKGRKENIIHMEVLFAARIHPSRKIFLVGKGVITLSLIFYIY